MTFEFFATLSTYIAFVASIWGAYLLRYLSQAKLISTTRFILLWHAFVYCGLLFFDVSYTYTWMTIEEWAVWRRVFARSSYGIMHLLWLFLITKAILPKTPRPIKDYGHETC